MSLAQSLLSSSTLVLKVKIRDGLHGFYPSTPDFAFNMHRRSTKPTHSDFVTAARLDDGDYQHRSQDFKVKASLAAARVETLMGSAGHWSVPTRPHPMAPGATHTTSPYTSTFSSS